LVSTDEEALVLLLPLDDEGPGGGGGGFGMVGREEEELGSEGGRGMAEELTPEAALILGILVDPAGKAELGGDELVAIGSIGAGYRGEGLLAGLLVLPSEGYAV
jgi:hypothetical protein